MLNKKVLAVAVLGALFSGNAAAISIGEDDPVVFAKEIDATGGVQLATSAAGASLDWLSGYNFSDGEVRYARLQCSSTIEFDTAAVITSSNTNVDIGSINGLGTNVLSFSVTSDAAGNVAADDTFTLDGDHTVTSTSAKITCQAGLYDQPSQAQAPITTPGQLPQDGLISTSTASGDYIVFGTSFDFVGTPGTATANVEAPNGAYTAFVTDGVFGALSFALKAATPLDVDGSPITFADLFDADTSVTVAGDFTAADDLTWNGTSADDISDDEATFEVGGEETTGDLQFFENGDDAIPESGYTATLNAVANDGYVIGAVPSVNVGEIVRNGTQLQAPLAQVPGGWISRLVLTNTGNAAREYTIKVQGETGNTISTANLTGTVPANGTKVIDDLNTVLTGFTGAPRATLNVTVAAPNNQIQGLYQIVNPDKGSVSNHVLVRPGTN